MNPILVKHGGKIVFGVTLVACGAIVGSYLSQPDPQEFSQLGTDKDTLKHALEAKVVTSNYHYSAENVKYAQHFKDNAGRLERVQDQVVAYAVYPKPLKPTIDPDTKPKNAAELTTSVDLAVKDLGDVSAVPDHGVIYVKYKIPAMDKKLMDVVRVEIFRGLKEDKVDTKAPYVTLDYNPEDFSLDAVPADEPETKEVKVDDKKEDAEKSSGSLRRQAHEAPAPVATATVKPAAKAEDVPAEMANVKVYPDTKVQPKSTYYYKVRMIARLNVEPEKAVVDAVGQDGKPTHYTVYHAPKNVESVAPAKAGTTAALYATPISSVVSATAPTEYEFRMAGTDGEISQLGTPVHLINENYKGIFVCRVWVSEAQEWREANITVPKGESLQGDAISGSKKPFHYPFDTKYELEEIKWKPATHEQTTKEVETNDKGEEIIDPNTNKPKIRTVTKTVDSVPVKVAMLKELTTGKLEECEQSNDFKRKEKGLEIIKALAAVEARDRAEQDKKWAAMRVKIKANEDKIKSDAEKIAGSSRPGLPGGPSGPSGPGGPGDPSGLNGPGGPGGGNGPGGPSGPGGTNPGGPGAPGEGRRPKY